MAKEDQGSWLLRHVEKVVLGATVALLLLVVGRWVISSPRQVEGLRPDQIDEAQMQEAVRVKKRHDDAKVPVEPRLLVIKKLARSTEHPIPLTYRMDVLTAVLPELEFPKHMLGPDEGPALADLVRSILAPERPDVWVGHELPLPNDDEILDDKFVAHVAAVLDVGKIGADWDDTLAGTGIDQRLIFHAIEAQVQEMRPDGTWGPARPVKMRVPELLDEDGEPYPVAEIPPFDGNNTEDIQEAIAAVNNNFIQAHILEPDYPRIYLPDYGWVSWRVHLPETRISRDARKLLEKEQEQPKRRRRKVMPRGAVYRLPPTDVRRPISSPGSFRETMRRRLESPRSTGRTRRPPTRRPPTRRPPIRERPTRSEETTERPEDRREELGAPPLVPGLAQQRRDGALLVWFHDVSLKSGRTYRYQVRLILVSPLYTRTADVKEGSEKDATIAKVATPWSPWSQGKRVASLTEFYIRGHTTTATGKKINVEVFSHSLGQRVVKRFKVHKGGVIGQKARVEVTNPLDDTVVSKIVDFATGAIAVNFDFRRRIYKGKNLDAAYTTAMLYLDNSGHLRVRTAHDDARDKGYKKLREKAKRTAETVVRAKAGELENRTP